MILLAGGAAVVAWMFWKYMNPASSPAPAIAPGGSTPAPPPPSSSSSIAPPYQYTDNPSSSSSSSPPARSVSTQGRLFIQGQEGFSLTPYNDAGGKSIYWGHRIQPGEHFAGTMTEARTVFAHDVAHVEAAINSHVRAPLSQNEYDALADLVYNIGVAAFERAHGLLGKLNAGDYAGAQQQIGLFVHSAGQVSPALVARRQADAQLFGVA